MKSSLLAALSFLAIAGCQVTHEVENPVTRDSVWYKETAVATVQQRLRDPESMRLISVSEPFAVRAALQGQTGVCVTLNAKNAYGGYAGASTYLVSFLGGHLRTWQGTSPVEDISASASLICP